MDSYWNDSAFTAGKKGAKFQARYVKGVPFLCKNCICTGLEVGAECPCMEICCVTPSPLLPFGGDLNEGMPK